MSTKNYRHAKLIGRIIFANVLEYSLKKYAGFIQGVKESPLFNELSQRKIINPQLLSEASSPCNSIEENPQVIARIKRKGRGFSINYINEDFNKIYISPHPNTQLKEIDRFLHRLRRVSSRNRLTHRILKEILKYQRKYLSSNNFTDMLPFSRVSVANKLNISLSWISRVIKGMTIILPDGQEKALSFFFPTKKEINKFRIKKLLDKEQELLETGKINKPLSDEEITVEFKKKYGRHLSRWSIGICRKILGIPSAKRRLSCYKYPPLSANFSLFYPLTIQSANTDVPIMSGIYEFSLKGRTIQYPKEKIEVFYIGSTKNLKKRLREHVGPSSKNGAIRTFLKTHNCLFRYIIMQKNWRKEEVKLYNLFLDTYGASPKCNKVRP